MLHAYEVTVSCPKHRDEVFEVQAAEPMLAAESAERSAWHLLGGSLPRYFAWKVEPARVSLRARAILAGAVR